MTRRLVAATTNRGKLREITRILAGLQIELVALDRLGLEPPAEDGHSFEANALIKARAAARASGLPALAEDSGLEVDALGGAPGVHSARYAGPQRDDRANLQKVLDELAGVPDRERTARFVCVAVIATPDGREWVARGTMHGHIADAPRGTGGFGYDPIFVGEGDTRTNGELPPEEKDARSHRGAAFRALRPAVEELLALPPGPR